MKFISFVKDLNDIQHAKIIKDFNLTWIWKYLKNHILKKLRISIFNKDVDNLHGLNNNQLIIFNTILDGYTMDKVMNKVKCL